MQLGAVQPPEPRDAVRTCPLLQPVEAIQFVLRCRDHELAALFVLHLVCRAEVAQETDPAPAEPRLERARLVIKTRVDDT